MPADRFAKAKANSKPLAEFMTTPEVSEWLEIEVRRKETASVFFHEKCWKKVAPQRKSGDAKQPRPKIEP